MLRFLRFVRAITRVVRHSRQLGGGSVDDAVEKPLFQRLLSFLLPLPIFLLAPLTTEADNFTRATPWSEICHRLCFSMRRQPAVSAFLLLRASSSFYYSAL